MRSRHLFLSILHPQRLVLRRLWRSLALLFGLTICCAAGAVLLPGGAQAQPVDRALAFTDSGYVFIGDPGDVFDLALGGERTFALWIRNDTTVYHVKLFDKRIPFTGEKVGYAIFIHQFTGTLGIYLDSTNEVSFNGAAGLRPISDGKWHHVAVVQADTRLHVFVDGHLDFSYTIPVDIAGIRSEVPLRLGWNSTDSIHFSGEMDDVSVWHRALSS